MKEDISVSTDNVSGLSACSCCGLERGERDDSTIIMTVRFGWKVDDKLSGSTVVALCKKCRRKTRKLLKE